LPWWHTPKHSLWSPQRHTIKFIAVVAQPGTAQDWKSCFLRDIPVQKKIGDFGNKAAIL